MVNLEQLYSLQMINTVEYKMCMTLGGDITVKLLEYKPFWSQRNREILSVSYDGQQRNNCNIL